MPTVTRGSFAFGSTSLRFSTGGWRQGRPEHRGMPAPCATACPAGETPRDYIALVEEGDLRGAWERLVAANPLPAITGRVCHHPCEGGCHRGQYDESIAIHNIERFLGDRAIAEGFSYPRPAAAEGTHEVAVVGAGPAGLSAAYHLVQQGLRVRLYDSNPDAGGLLRSALPPYRLPRAVLDQEIERVLAAGIVFQPNTRVGRDVSIDELQKNFGAVFLAPGTERPRSWSVDGVEPGRLRSGIDLLKEWISIGEVPTQGKVAIVGGGNTAIDLARVLKFNSAAEVHVITFQVLPNSGVSTADAMSAVPREISQALEEGVIIHDRRGIRRLIMRGDTLAGVEMVHMQEIEQPGSGRKLVSFEGTETVLKLDHVIPAVGQEVDGAGFERLVGKNAFFSVDQFGRLANHAGIFVGGDARGGRGTVSGAIGDGRRSALAIAAYVRGLGAPAEPSVQPIGYGELNLNYFDHARRIEAPILRSKDRSSEAEIEGSLSRDDSHAEASRCLSCGECMSCDNCWTLCPDNSVLKAKEDGDSHWRYLFDYDHCKGCGICAHECPTGYIKMVDET